MKMNKLLLLVLTLSLVACANNPSTSTSSTTTTTSSSTSKDPQPVDYYDGYYSSLLSWKNSDDLKNQLHTIIHGGNYTPLKYVNNYASNSNADHVSFDFEILDIIYSQDNCSSSKTNVGWQKEHCFPASLMTGSTTTNATKFLGRATDLHNLYAASSGANSSRGNKNYGVPDTTSKSYVNRMTNGTLDGYRFDETFFEPGDIDKGKVARSIFYVATMYSETEKDTVNNVTMKGITIQEEPVTYVAGDDCKFSIGGLSTLLKWNNSYKVSDIEAQHNQSVFSYVPESFENAQGNRNPYIDFPELVDYVFGDKKNQAGRLDALTPSIKTLSREKEGFHNYAIYSAKREYNCGDTFSISDYSLVSVNNDFSYTTYTGSTSCSLDKHVFSKDDGDKATSIVFVDSSNINYDIAINQAGECSNIFSFKKSQIDNTKVKQDQLITDSTTSLLFNVDAPSGFLCNNDIQRGGIKLGSSNSVISGITIKTNKSYTIDAVFLETFAATKASSYSLTIKIGDDVIFNKLTVDNNSSEYKQYGGRLSERHTGILTFELKGSVSIGLRSLAFNVVE